MSPDVGDLVRVVGCPEVRRMCKAAYEAYDLHNIIGQVFKISAIDTSKQCPLYLDLPNLKGLNPWFRSSELELVFEV